MALKQSGDKVMTETPLKRTGAPCNLWRLAGWATIAGLIALPAIAMQFTTDVDWGPEDFAFAVIMLGGVGLAFEVAVRASGDWAYRGGAAVALGVGLVTLWANAAVGIVGNEENDLNMWFNAVPLVALVGTIVARFRARGMAFATTLTAIAQIIVGVIIQFSGDFAWVFTVTCTVTWLLSAWLFREAARA
jgi:hypothetical protein